jgi:hypothetical protein
MPRTRAGLQSVNPKRRSIGQARSATIVGQFAAIVAPSTVRPYQRDTLVQGFGPRRPRHLHYAPVRIRPAAPRRLGARVGRPAPRLQDSYVTRRESSLLRAREFTAASLQHDYIDQVLGARLPEHRASASRPPAAIVLQNDLKERLLATLSEPRRGRAQPQHGTQVSIRGNALAQSFFKAYGMARIRPQARRAFITTNRTPPSRLPRGHGAPSNLRCVSCLGLAAAPEMQAPADRHFLDERAMCNHSHAKSGSSSRWASLACWKTAPMHSRTFVRAFLMSSGTSSRSIVVSKCASAVASVSMATPGKLLSFSITTPLWWCKTYAMREALCNETSSRQCTVAAVFRPLLFKSG